jgi:hypothetical protein
VVPREFLVSYVVANVLGVGVLMLAFRRPRLVRWFWAAVFAWAASVNVLTSVRTPWEYMVYAALTPAEAYRGFIEGWVSQHVRPMVLSIAAGQIVIALLLVRGSQARRTGVVGATIFLLAIAPLGVGSAFPFGLTAIASLLVMERGLAAMRRPGLSPAARFVPAPDARDEHCIDVAAPAAVVFDTATHLDLLSEAVPAALVRARAALVGDRPVVRRPAGLVAETLGLGWGVLHCEPGRTLVMGAVARPWARDVTFTAVEPESFASHAAPDLVKIVWTLEVEARGLERSRFRTETRVAATDAAARRHFRWYWLLFGSGIRLIRWSVLRAVRRDAQRRFGVTGPAVGAAA